MDAGRFLTLSTALVLGSCASDAPAPPAVSPVAEAAAFTAPANPDARPGRPGTPAAPAPAPGPAGPPRDPGPSVPGPDSAAPPRPSLMGRAAIAAANLEARTPSAADAFVGGVQVFAFAPGRIYEVWTAPLRVTVLTLAEGERVTATAAGDTLRWRIGEAISGTGAGARVNVLIKPLETGLQTNLVLTTTRGVYLLHLRSGPDDAFNAAVAWDEAALRPQTPRPAPDSPVPPDLAVVEPAGPIDAAYRIEPRGRAPRWTPVSVFNDGVRTFIVLDPRVAVDEAPALFVIADGEAQMTNYRQAGDRLIVDRVFDVAELRLGVRRPQVVRIHRLEARR